MKKIQFLFPAVAITLATAGAFVPMQPEAAALSVAVTASPTFCTLDGFCSQQSASICKIASTGTIFFHIQGAVCATAATGHFHQ